MAFVSHCIRQERALDHGRNLALLQFIYTCINWISIPRFDVPCIAKGAKVSIASVINGLLCSAKTLIKSDLIARVSIVLCLDRIDFAMRKLLCYVKALIKGIRCDHDTDTMIGDVLESTESISLHGTIEEAK